MREVAAGAVEMLGVLLALVALAAVARADPAVVATPLQEQPTQVVEGVEREMQMAALAAQA
jgi:hypothetical protein